MSELYKCPLCRADMRLAPRFGGGHVYMCHNDACEVVGQEIGTTMLEALNRRAPSAEQDKYAAWQAEEHAQYLEAGSPAEKEQARLMRAKMSDSAAEQQQQEPVANILLRDKFEEWTRPWNLELGTVLGSYVDERTELSWYAWQGCAAIHAHPYPHPQPQAQGEPNEFAEIEALAAQIAGMLPSQQMAHAAATLRKKITDVRWRRLFGQPRAAVPDKREWQQVLGRDDKQFTDGWNACRDAMLAAVPDQPGSKFPEELTPEMLKAAQQNTEIGAFVCGNWAGGYEVLDQLWAEWMKCIRAQPGDAQGGEG